MMSTIKVLLWLFCGASARGFNRNFQSANLRSHPPVVQQPAAVKQEQQSQEQPFYEPLTWRYPDPPAKEEPQYPQDFELKTPTAANSISVTCHEDSVRVEVEKDLLGIGKPVLSADVSLGGCPATGEDPNTQVLVFESALHGCGSQLQMSEDSFIYVFTLIYTPSPLGDSPIVRTIDVSVNIECHYQRKQDVSTGMVKPTWNPFTDTKSAEENLYFSLELMTDNWQYPHPSNQFLLGDVMKFKVSVKQFYHVPLRVFVDSCVATVIPNIDTVPRYLFLGNKGCLFDSQLTGASSRFLPRTLSDELQFEVEAFRFQQDHSGVIYITCSLKATAATAAVDANNKACSFSDRWLEASGINQACSCCNGDCGTGGQSQLSRTVLGLKTSTSRVSCTLEQDIVYAVFKFHLIPLCNKESVWEQETAVGPIVVKDKPLR